MFLLVIVIYYVLMLRQPCRSKAYTLNCTHSQTFSKNEVIMELISLELLNLREELTTLRCTGDFVFRPLQLVSRTRQRASRRCSDHYFSFCLISNFCGKQATFPASTPPKTSDSPLPFLPVFPKSLRNFYLGFGSLALLYSISKPPKL